jgi:hypothetical protein
MMTLGAYLQRERGLLVSRWFALVAASYPPELARVIATDPDEFRNPVGHAFRASLEGLVGELFGETFDQARVQQLLEPVVRIRAVQCLSPDEAVGFVFGLKRVVREVSGVVRETPTFTEELRDLEDRIDRTALVACDLFSRCRARIASIRARQQRLQAMTGARLERRKAGGAARADVRPFPVSSGDRK